MLDSAQRRDSAVEDCLLPDTQGGELLLLPDNPRPLEFRWAFLFDLLTSEHRPPEEATGQCFRKLIVGASHCKAVTSMVAETKDWRSPTGCAGLAIARLAVECVLCCLRGQAECRACQADPIHLAQ